ncbi:hypothetical protein [Brevibacillus sp. SYSU BS000544]|uniref:hypothetical protein n=1 Tax=Brevibacillus sp. SYSU BS000544 TaxID=3416443 RepID=UPI003CE564F1
MKGILSFMLILLYFVPVIVGIVGFSEMQQEKAEVRGIWEQVLREMSAEGYLSPSVKNHYTQVLQKRGYSQGTPFFVASHVTSSSRAIRPQHGEFTSSQNQVTLTIQVEPTPWVRAIVFLHGEKTTFKFTGTMISEYIP